MWPRPRLYAAEVALKLQLPHLNRRIFFQVRFGEAESVPAGKLFWCEGFAQLSSLLLLVGGLLVF